LIKNLDLATEKNDDHHDLQTEENAEMNVPEEMKCTMSSVTSVAKRQSYPSSQLMVNQYYVEIALTENHPTARQTDQVETTLHE
jgi:hypothetical protein